MAMDETVSLTEVDVTGQFSVSEFTLGQLAAEDRITVDEAYRRHNAECLARFGTPLQRRAGDRRRAPRQVLIVAADGAGIPRLLLRQVLCHGDAR
jgi:hypothetical protein